MEDKEMGKRIYETRKGQGLTQVKLAELCGINKTMLSRYENGKSMNLDTLKIIAEKLNVSLDYLVYGNNAPSKKQEKGRGDRVVDALVLLEEENLIDKNKGVYEINETVKNVLEGYEVMFLNTDKTTPGYKEFRKAKLKEWAKSIS